MEQNLIYTIYLVLFLYGAVRFMMKEKGNYGLVIPFFMFIVFGSLLIDEKLPLAIDKVMFLGIVLIFMVTLRVIYRRDVIKEVTTAN